MSNDWFPSRRSDQILMAKNWEHQMTTWGEMWGVPKDVKAKLKSLRVKAENDLHLATGANPTPENIQKCRDTLKELQAYMRNIKSRYFKKPPLKNEHFVALGLKVPDRIKSPVPKPEASSSVEVSYLGISRLRLHLSRIDGAAADKRAEYGRRIYWGVMPPGGATLEQAAGKGHYLMKRPVSGEELAHSKLTRRARETIEFPSEDSGSTAYFCVRYENSKGEPGPWGPIFSAVIP